jgi:hypothetical protein
MIDQAINHDLNSLYTEAFDRFGVRALWSLRPVEKPTPADAMAITRSLRTWGGMEGRRLAEKIESLCSASH